MPSSDRFVICGSQHGASDCNLVFLAECSQITAKVAPSGRRVMISSSRHFRAAPKAPLVQVVLRLGKRLSYPAVEGGLKPPGSGGRGV